MKASASGIVPLPNTDEGNLTRSAESERMASCRWYWCDQERRPCAPVHPGRARHLLIAGWAAVFRRYPFTLILREGRSEPRIRATPDEDDPGSRPWGSPWSTMRQGRLVWPPAWRIGAAGEARLDQRRASSPFPPPAPPAIARRASSSRRRTCVGCHRRWRAGSATC